MPIKNSATFDQTNIINKIKKIQEIANKTHYRGFSYCRLCNKTNNGAIEYAIDNFVWPEGYLHYVKEHNVAVDKEFAEYVNKFDSSKNHVVSFPYSYQ